ncbi:MAG: VOC family protein [Polyangiaceae bacterium]
MFAPKTQIYLNVDDAGPSSAFYEALLGVPPASKSAGMAIFDLESPPLILTLDARASAQRVKVRAHGVAPPMLRDQKGGAPRATARPGFALLVTEPSHVGHAAIALRRAGIPLRIEDQGIEARDPDGNEWRVRFAPKAAGRAVVMGAEDR